MVGRERPFASVALESALRALEEMPRGFNVFEAAGLITQEVRHSHFLAHMLNPRGKHGLGTALTDAFVAEVFEDEQVSDIDAWQVRREWQYIDILLEDKQRRRVFVVENKLGAGEHGDQLARYFDVTARAFPESTRRYAFLSPDAREPTHGEYRATSYEAVVRAFERVLRSVEAEPRVRSVIEDYLVLLRRYVLPGSDEDAVCRKIWLDHEVELGALMPGQVAMGEDRNPSAADDPDIASIYPIAWALLAKNRPDVKERTLALALSLRGAEVAAGTATVGFTSDVCVAFRPPAWMSEQERLRRLGWGKERGYAYPLYFELEARLDRLHLHLWVADKNVPVPLREAALAWARTQPKLTASLPGQLRGGAVSLVKVDILSPADYEQPVWSRVEAVARSRFERFVAEEMPSIVRAALDIQWPDSPRAESTS